MKTTFGQRLKQARKEAGLTQKELATKAGIKQATISELEHDKYQGSAFAPQLAAALLVNALWLANEKGAKHITGIRDASIISPNSGLIKDLPTTGKPRISGETSGEPDDANVWQSLQGHRQIPILTLEQASKMAVTIDPFTLGEGLGTVTTYREVSASAFAIPIKGPSMLPRFEDGDVVIIDPTRPPKPGKFVLAGTITGEAVFRKYRELGANDVGQMVFELAPLNDDFATLHSERDRLRIIGAMDAHINYDRDE